MARLPIITEEIADEKTRKTYAAIASKFGMVPNIFKGMANSTVTLNAYLALDEMIAAGSFSSVEQDIVRMTVSQYNDCRYCVPAHTRGLLSKKVTREETLNIRRDIPTDPKHAALVAFTLKVVQNQGFVSDDDIPAFKKAGFSDTHAAEITVIIAQKILSNYFNHINNTDLDLPAAPGV
jgi:uncharacterized peroxidase-related enzyme